jgi:predicted ATPase/class 3 adenylate cyclase
MNMQERMLRDLRAKMPSAMLNKFLQGSKELFGQRREVTVLEVEIVNLTSTANEIDSETTFLAVDEIVHLLADIVYKYEGTIDKYSENGITALFGLPLNHENDPERAVRAGMEMLYGMDKIQERLVERHHHEFTIQIGINTGSVIAGVLNDDQHLEYTVIGDTVHLATLLQKAAGPGRILINFSTYQRTRPIINYQSLVPLTAEGETGPIMAYQPLGVRAVPGQVRGLPGLQVPMVGRREQLDTLAEIYNKTIDNNSSEIVFCSGEAGIGKSRLMAEFRNYLSTLHTSMVQGTCALYMRITPYRVVADILRNILGISELDPISEQRKILSKNLEQLELEQSDILPYILLVLGILHSDPILEVRIRLLDPSMLLRQTHFALRLYLIALSRKTPLVMVFDDLHWVDQPSSQFLEYLCQSLENTPLLLILVARDFEKYTFAKSIRTAAEKHTQRPHDLEVKPLTESDGQLLVDHFVHEDTKPAREIKSLIASRAGGNPYYTEELVRILIDNGGLVNEGGTWHLTLDAAQHIKKIPGTLSDIILARFDHLPEHLRNILLRASILGDTFSARLLQAIVAEDTRNLPECLAELEARDFLIHTKFDIEEGYIFKHPLLSETIYQILLKRDLQRLHTKVAEEIEKGNYWLPGERNQVLAYHLSESKKPASSIPYFLISAEKAYQHFANDTAVQLYRQALSLMSTLTTQDSVQKIRAQVGLAKALKLTGELEEASRLLKEIVEEVSQGTEGLDMNLNPAFQNQIDALCELADIQAREGNLDYAVQLLQQGKGLLGEACRVENPTIWRRVVDRLAWVYFRQRNLDEAYNLVDLALLDSPTSEAEDPITMASLYNTMGGIYWTRSRFKEAIDCVEHSQDIYKNLHYHWGMANSMANLGILHYSTEKWTEAVGYLEQADRLRREYGDDPERPINLWNLGEVLTDLGKFKEARINLETSREISQRLGLNLPQTHAEFSLCRLAILEDRIEEARHHLQNAENLLSSLGDSNDRTAQYYLLQAMVEIRSGDLEKGKTSVERALEISKSEDIPEKQVDALRIRGIIYTIEGKFEEAENSYSKSIELAQELKDRFSEAKASHEMGKLLMEKCHKETENQRVDLKKAGRSLEAAIHIFEALGAGHDLQLAKDSQNQLTSIINEDNFSQHKIEIENQMNDLRAQLQIPAGELYLASVFSIVLKPKPRCEEELIFETIAFLIPSISEMIQGNGGQVIHHQNRITAIFGAPVVHEDDPERAVESMMQIINSFNELDQQAEMPVSIHIGGAMGKIAAGKSSPETSNEFLAAGEPVQNALRIAEKTPAGRVWVTQSINSATAFRFEFTPTPINNTETSDEGAIFQFEGLREQILPVRGFIGLKTPFIGRDKELEAMEHMGKVLEGQTGGIIWIEGEPGMGKSRLMREFSKQVAKYKPLVLGAVCSARSSEYAFSLFSDLLMKVFDIQYNFTPNQIIEHIDGRINEWLPELLEMRPFLELLLGVQPGGVQGEHITSMEPEQLRRQTFVVIHRLFSMLSSKQPLVLILDDLQWIDSISADLLLYLSHLVVSTRILFVCAKRENEVSPFDQTLERTSSTHPDQSIHLSIHPLTNPECRQLLNELLTSADLPESVQSLIIQQSGGNPYFIEEFVRLLIEKDFLRMDRGKLIANKTLQADALSIPASLESLIRARVDSLDNNARHLLQVASVIGHSFTSSLLAKVLEHENNEPILAQLKSSGMLNSTAEDDYWEFSHPLIEVIVYNSVLRAQRRILHFRAAQCLENQWKGNEDDHAEDLAYHFQKAEVYDRALHYLITAGERASIRHANDLAVSFFEQAIELLNSVPNVGDETRWRIIHQIGEVYQFIGSYDTSLAVLQSGLDLLENPKLSPWQRAGIYRRMGDTAHKKGDQEQAINYLKKALEILGEPTDNPSLIEGALIYARLGWCYFMKSDLEPAKDAVNQSMVYAGLAKNVTTLAMAENYLGGIYYRQGNLQQAMQHTRTAMNYWQEIGYSWGVAAALSNLGILENTSGNWQAAYNSIKRSLDLRQKMGDVDGVAITNHNLGQLAFSLGDSAQAELYFRDSLSVSRPLQMNWHAANSYVGLAQTLLAQGKTDDADESLQLGFNLAQEINAPDVIAEAYCTQAEILLAKSEAVQAEYSAQNAARLAEQIGVGPLIATAWRLISASRLQRGEKEQASQALDNARQTLDKNPDQLEEGRFHVQAMLLAKACDEMEQAQMHRKAAEEVFKILGAARELAHLESC